MVRYRTQRRGRFGLILFMISSLLCWPAPFAQASGVIFVAPGGSGSQSGASWANAKDLQPALQSASSGTQIWAKQGAYTPTTTANRSATFQLVNGVALYGGFAGTETTLTQRNITAYTATLSGDLANSFHVVTGSGTNTSAVLDGFVITGGSAELNSSPTESLDEMGAGMLNVQGSPTLRNLTFIDNQAYWYGGGMANLDHSSPVLMDVSFLDNLAGHSGGGMFNRQSSNPQIRQTLFRANSAQAGGGMANDQSSPGLFKVDFIANQATTSSGGALFNRNQSLPVIRHSLFFHNDAVTNGGGIANDTSAARISYARFIGNYSQLNGGGISNVESDASIEHTIFSNNRPGCYGSAIYNFLSAPTISHIVTNDVRGCVVKPIYNVDSTPTIRNSILWGSRDPVVNLGAGEADIQFSLVRGGYPGVGNIDANPLFTDADGTDNILGTVDDDLRLHSLSPALDAGNNSFIPADIDDEDGDNDTAEPAPFDLAGQPRLQNSTVDMGAFEGGFVTCAPTSRLYVNKQALGQATGLSWADAYPELRLATELANHCSVIAGIWIAQGEYKPTDGSDRGTSFKLNDDLRVYGGFSGGETALEQRNPDLHQVILNGDLLGNDSGAVSLDNPLRQDNSYHVISTHDTYPELVIDGVTVRGGQANSADVPHNEGGGISVYYGNATLNDVRIEANAAINGGGLASGGEVALRAVRFVNNSAENGGGFALYGEATVAQSVFENNQASVYGGGLYAHSYGLVQISRSGFHGNSAPSGGAIFTAQETTISNALFNGNDAVEGGAITSYYSSLLIGQSTFTSNSASDGSALKYTQRTPEMHNSLLWNNSASLFSASNTTDVTVTHSLVQGGYPGSGNLAADPLLLDLDGPDGLSGTLDDDLRLPLISPALDAGDNALIPADTLDADADGDLAEAAPFDYAGMARIFNATVDMGAYEYHPAFISPLPAATLTYGAVYSHTFIAFTDRPTVTYHLTAGTLPTGMLLNTTTGVLSGTAHAVGIYTATVEARAALSSELQQFTISVVTAPLTVTAVSQIRLVGAANPALTVAYSGFVAGDSAAVLSGAPTCTTSATSASPPGAYAITCSQGTLAASSYHVAAFVPGVLTVVADSQPIFLPLIVR